jgi:hypothetical protein
VLETLKKHQPLANLKKCEFSQQYLVYFGYVIDGGELNIDTMNMKSIMKWIVPTKCHLNLDFFWETQFLKNFLASFLAVARPLHAITASGNSL